MDLTESCNATRLYNLAQACPHNDDHLPSIIYDNTCFSFSFDSLSLPIILPSVPLGIVMIIMPVMVIVVIVVIMIGVTTIIHKRFPNMQFKVSHH